VLSTQHLVLSNLVLSSNGIFRACLFMRLTITQLGNGSEATDFNALSACYVDIGRFAPVL